MATTLFHKIKTRGTRSIVAVRAEEEEEEYEDEVYEDDEPVEENPDDAEYYEDEENAEGEYEEYEDEDAEEEYEDEDETLDDYEFEDQGAEVDPSVVYAVAPEPEYDPNEDFEVPLEANIQSTGACFDGSDCADIVDKRFGTGALMLEPGLLVNPSATPEITLGEDMCDWPEVNVKAVSLPALKVDEQMDAGYLRFQGSTSSCVMHAYCGLWYHEMRKIDPQCSYPSRLWMTSRIGGTCGGSGGSDPTTSFNFASTVGMLPEGIIKEDSTGFKSMTASQCVNSTSYARDASMNSTASAFRTKALPGGRPTYLFQDFRPGTTPAADKARLIYTSLAAGFPVMIFMTIGTVQVQDKGAQSLYTLAGAAPITGLPQNTIYHAVVLCGFKVVNGLPCFRLKNSWAIDVYQGGVLKSGGWGDDGYAWLSAEAGGMGPLGMAASYKDNPFGVAPGSKFRGPIPGPPPGAAVAPPQAAVPKPTAPVKPTTPAKPTTTPAKPATTPVKPTTTPAKPATTPAKPATTPVKPTAPVILPSASCTFHQTSNCPRCNFPPYATVIIDPAGSKCIPCKKTEDYAKICGRGGATTSFKKRMD